MKPTFTDALLEYLGQPPARIDWLIFFGLLLMFARAHA